VVSQESREFVQAVCKEYLEGGTHRSVKLFPILPQQRFVDDLLDENVFEGVREVRVGEPADELRLFQLEELGLEIRGRAQGEELRSA
jgi:hypothetical protein